MRLPFQLAFLGQPIALAKKIPGGLFVEQSVTKFKNTRDVIVVTLC